MPPMLLWLLLLSHHNYGCLCSMDTLLQSVNCSLLCLLLMLCFCYAPFFPDRTYFPVLGGARKLIMFGLCLLCWLLLLWLLPMCSFLGCCFWCSLSCAVVGVVAIAACFCCP